MYYVTLLITRKLYVSHKFWINLFVIFYNTIFCWRQVHLRSPKIVNHQHKANTEIFEYIKGSLIVVRDIMTLIYIVWFQWFLYNTLLLSTSVIDFPGPKRDVFSIVIVHLILRSSLVGFSMLPVRYYYNCTWLVWYVYYVYNL